MRKELERTTPEAAGIRSEDVIHLVETLEASGTQMHGIMIIRHNKVAAEGWWSPYAPGIRHGCQSLTKTYTATAIGLLYDEGKVALDEKIIDIFPEYVPARVDERMHRITVRHALCMGCGMYKMPDVASADWLKEYFTIPILKEPGESFFYNSATSALLAAIVRKKTGLSMLEYLQPRLFDKIGIDTDNLRILKMPDGYDNGGGGLFSTTEDNARLMLLYLNKGVWDGEQILSEEWVRMASSYQNATAEDQGIYDCRLGYGFQMWMCRPEGVYRADGAYGQYAIAFPELDMVIAINETARMGVWPQRVLDIVWDEFMPRVEKGVPQYPENKKAYEKLENKMKSLTLDIPGYRPVSDFARKNRRLVYELEKNKLTVIPTLYHNLTGLKREQISKITFEFVDTNTMKLICTYDGYDYEFTIGMDGNGRYNHGLLKECVPQMTYAYGEWKRSHELYVHMNYIETCFEKDFTFLFEDDKIKIQTSESNTNVTDQGIVREKVDGKRIKE